MRSSAQGGIQADQEGGALAAAAESLFPLPLAPFERYMLMDDRQGNPMSIIITAHISGDLSHLQFESALLAALQRHPLLNCHVHEISGRGPSWVPVSGQALRMQWLDGDVPIPVPEPGSMDLRKHTGLRIWARGKEDGYSITFQMHHACCDGLGAIQFIGDVLAIYGQNTASEGEELPELHELVTERLRDRHIFANDPEEKSQPLFSCPINLARKFVKLMRRRPVPLAAPGNPHSSVESPSHFPGIVSRTISRQDVLRLKAYAASQGVSLNDLCLQTVFLSIRDWNQRHGRLSGEQWMRLGMPTNLRTPLHDGLPAANVVSMMFLTRQMQACGHPQELLKDICRQTSAIVNDRQGRYLVNGIRHVLRVPYLLNLLLRLKTCYATAIVTNVGDYRRHFNARFPMKQGRCVAGNIVLEGMHGSAPIRRGTRMSVSLGIYGGQLTINFLCDPSHFSHRHTSEFANLTVERLLRVIANSATGTQQDAA